MELKINIRPYTKLYHYVKFAKGEVSAIGKVRKVKGDFVVTDIHLIDQICTGASTTLNEEALMNFIYKRVIKGERIENYCLWFHSHAGMGVFWSTIDEDNISRLKTKYPLVSLLMNKRGEMIARLDKQGEELVQLEIVIVPGNRTGLIKECKKEINKKVYHYSYHKKRFLGKSVV